MNSRRRVSLSLLLLTGLAGLSPRPAAAQKTYLAVGDSLAYGFMDSSTTPVGKSDTPNYYPGYVTPYANFLSTQTGATYNVVNLGIVGETAGRLNSPSLADGTPNAALNTNYGAGDTQMSLLDSAVVAAGPSLGVITIQVGANDILEALASSPDPMTALANAQIAINEAGLDDAVLLSHLRADEGGGPLSNVTLIGYYNPFAGLPDSSPYAYLKTISPGLTMGLNSVIQLEAQTFGARYVDLYDPFLGHENADTLVNTDTFNGFPNDHPNSQGYALIAQTLAAPEPSSGAPLCLGALGLAGLAFRARRRRA